MASPARIDELKKKFDENPRRYFAPLANEFRKAGDIEQAIMICEEFLPQQPGHMSGHIVYGQALYEARRLDESRTVFETALGLDPENLIALRHLGDIARGRATSAAARSWYQRVLDADPRNEEIQALIAGLADRPPAARRRNAQRRGRDGAGRVRACRTPRARTGSRRRAKEASRRRCRSRSTSSCRSRLAGTGAHLRRPSRDADADRAGRAEGLDERSSSRPPDAGRWTTPHDLGASLEAGEFSAPAAPIARSTGSRRRAWARSSAAPPRAGPRCRCSIPTSPRRGAPTTRRARRCRTSARPTLEFSVPVAHRPHGGRRARGVRQHARRSSREGDSGCPISTPRRRARRGRRDVRRSARAAPSVIAAEAQLHRTSASRSRWSCRRRAREADAAHRRRERGGGALPSAEPEVAEEPVSRPRRRALVRHRDDGGAVPEAGFRDQARDVYRQLLAASPHDERLQRVVADLRAGSPAAEGAIGARLPVAHRLAPAVRAGRRGGGRAAARRPTTSPRWARCTAAVPDAPAARDASRVRIGRRQSAASAPVSCPRGRRPPGRCRTGIERAASTQRRRLDRRAVRHARARARRRIRRRPRSRRRSAAPPERRAAAGRPAGARRRRASSRSTACSATSAARPPRTSQSFSFDQFFSPDSGRPSAAAPPARRLRRASGAPTSAPAERSADDIEQFNSWLQGLKPR